MARRIKYYVVFAVVMMMILSSSCLGVNKISRVVVERRVQEQPQESADADDVASPGNSPDNHHHIPRPEFGNNSGGDTDANIDGCGRSCG